MINLKKKYSNKVKNNVLCNSYATIMRNIGDAYFGFKKSYPQGGCKFFYKPMIARTPEPGIAIGIKKFICFKLRLKFTWLDEGHKVAYTKGPLVCFLSSAAASGNPLGSEGKGPLLFSEAESFDKNFFSYKKKNLYQTSHILYRLRAPWFLACFSGYQAPLIAGKTYKPFTIKKTILGTALRVDQLGRALLSNSSMKSFLLSDFVDIQRKSFFELLEKGLIEEFSKRNPITNKNLEIFFYPEYYQLTPSEYNPRRAILYSKSYSAKLFIPVQLTDKKLKKSQLKWVLIGNLPLMTKRGHFILNGAPRVIVNQILRSPGIYFQGSLKEIFSEKWSEKPEITYKRFYTDLICLKGTWLRIEIDKNKDIWAQMKKIPKIPILWFLLAMGLTERIIFKSVINPTRLLANFNLDIKRKITYNYVTNPSDAWKEIANLLSSNSYRNSLPFKSLSNINDKDSLNHDQATLTKSKFAKDTWLDEGQKSISQAKQRQSDLPIKIYKKGQAINPGQRHSGDLYQNLTNNKDSLNKQNLTSHGFLLKKKKIILNTPSFISSTYSTSKSLSSSKQRHSGDFNLVPGIDFFFKQSLKKKSIINSSKSGLGAIEKAIKSHIIFKEKKIVNKNISKLYLIKNFIEELNYKRPLSHKKIAPFKLMAPPLKHSEAINFKKAKANSFNSQATPLLKKKKFDKDKSALDKLRLPKVTLQKNHNSFSLSAGAKGNRSSFGSQAPWFLATSRFRGSRSQMFLRSRSGRLSPKGKPFTPAFRGLEFFSYLYSNSSIYKKKILSKDLPFTPGVLISARAPEAAITKKLISFLTFSEQSKEGRNWIFKRFMNPRTYDLGKQGRLNFNRKLGLSLSSNQTTLTAQDVLYATDYLLKLEKGLKKIDDIDHLKNRRVRTSGELLQIQIGIGLVRLEKMIRENLALKTNTQTIKATLRKPISNKKKQFKKEGLTDPMTSNFRSANGFLKKQIFKVPKHHAALAKRSGIIRKDIKTLKQNLEEFSLSLTNIINTKAFNGALREFFGTSQLSQFMDQLNPLAEITHKRRLSSMGPGGVTRDSATLAIRGIHPTHYGRICPIETPEGKNTGLVNSLTTYARANSQGFLESPFYKVYKGQIQKNDGIYFFSAEQEEKIKVAAADVSSFSGRIGFLPKSKITSKIGYSDTISKISRNKVEYIGLSPIQMISIATSLIPFLEHDDANRALMGSNMQRQAVPLIRAERPLVGTGLESRTVSDSGHALVAKESGYIAYVSAKKIVIYTISSS